MIALIQRVRNAHVEVHEERVSEIDKGILAFIGVERGDSESQALRLLERVLGYRIFPDSHGKMNKSVADIKGGVLLVPQFTLVADTHKGTRPSFSSAAKPGDAEHLFERLCVFAKRQYDNIAIGRFGADMQVYLVNDGPVTFWLQVSPKWDSKLLTQNV